MFRGEFAGADAADECIAESLASAERAVVEFFGAGHVPERGGKYRIDFAVIQLVGDRS